MTKTLKEIRRGEEEFEQKFIGNSMLDLFGHEGSPKNLREHHNRTLRNTLTALKEEVGEMELKQKAVSVFKNYRDDIYGYNQALQDVLDLLDDITKDI